MPKIASLVAKINKHLQRDVERWYRTYNASTADPKLWDDPSYQYDIVNVLGQILSNPGVRVWNASTRSAEQGN